VSVTPTGTFGEGNEAPARNRAYGLRGVHALAVAAILLAAVAVRATEAYTTRYQSLPVLDWIESRPPLTESADVPAATDLARGVSRVLPLLTIRDDVRPRLPAFGPPGVIQRTAPGVRDAARIELGSPGAYVADAVPVRARLDVIVFHRAVRAAAWSESMRREMDIRDPESGLAQVRTSGPDEPDGVWLVAPRFGGGVATVAGRRGPIGFMLQVTFVRPNATEPSALADLSARAEASARTAAGDWAKWLTTQLPA
jgi:hypothetical protein